MTAVQATFYSHYRPHCDRRHDPRVITRIRIVYDRLVIQLVLTAAALFLTSVLNVRLMK